MLPINTKIVEPYSVTYTSNSYAHTIIVYASEQTQQDNFDGYVYANIHFALGTKDLSSNNKVRSEMCYANLPAPDANNFVVFTELTQNTIIDWIKENYDINSLEEANLQKLR